MAITHVDGDFFGSEHSAGHKNFGFGGSVGQSQPPAGKAEPAQKPDYPMTKTDKTKTEPPDQYAMGGEVGPHPHGDLVTSSMEHPDGRFVEQHAHGGHTVYHPDGRITHHMHDGTPVGFPLMGSNTGGVEGMHDSQAEYAHRSPSEDETPNRQLAQGVADEAETGDHLARGGRPRLPRDMRPMGMRPHSPIETPPRKAQITRTPTNSMPGGAMPYGTQPSDEPGQMPTTDDTGSTPPGMKRGGRMVHDDDDDGE